MFIALIFAVFMLAYIMLTLQSIEFKSKTAMRINLISDDKGSFAVSAFQSTNGGKTYMELFGSGDKSSADMLAEKTTKLEGVEYFIKNSNNKNSYKMEIPIQGGKFTQVDVYGT